MGLHPLVHLEGQGDREHHRQEDGEAHPQEDPAPVQVLEGAYETHRLLTPQDVSFQPEDDLQPRGDGPEGRADQDRQCRGFTDRAG